MLEVIDGLLEHVSPQTDYTWLIYPARAAVSTISSGSLLILPFN